MKSPTHCGDQVPLFSGPGGVQGPGLRRKKVELFSLNGHLVSTSVHLSQILLSDFLNASWDRQTDMTCSQADIVYITEQHGLLITTGRGDVSLFLARGQPDMS